MAEAVASTSKSSWRALSPLFGLRLKRPVSLRPGLLPWLRQWLPRLLHQRHQSRTRTRTTSNFSRRMPTAPQPVREVESLGDAARRSKQRRACLELAKDNPSIACK